MSYENVCEYSFDDDTEAFKVVYVFYSTITSRHME